jgi:hypothetical protein
MVNETWVVFFLCKKWFIFSCRSCIHKTFVSLSKGTMTDSHCVGCEFKGFYGGASGRKARVRPRLFILGVYYLYWRMA